MKRYIVLFAIFITAIFFYPVFAHSDEIGNGFVNNRVTESGTLFFLGSGLLIAAAFIKKHIGYKAL